MKEMNKGEHVMKLVLQEGSNFGGCSLSGTSSPLETMVIS